MKSAKERAEKIAYQTQQTTSAGYTYLDETTKLISAELEAYAEDMRLQEQEKGAHAEMDGHARGAKESLREGLKEGLLLALKVVDKCRWSINPTAPFQDVIGSIEYFIRMEVGKCNSSY